jgi:hypothetical protein
MFHSVTDTYWFFIPTALKVLCFTQWRTRTHVSYQLFNVLCFIQWRTRTHVSYQLRLRCYVSHSDGHVLMCHTNCLMCYVSHSDRHVLMCHTNCLMCSFTQWRTRTHVSYQLLKVLCFRVTDTYSCVIPTV